MALYHSAPALDQFFLPSRECRTVTRVICRKSRRAQPETMSCRPSGSAKRKNVNEKKHHRQENNLQLFNAPACTRIINPGTDCRRSPKTSGECGRPDDVPERPVPGPGSVCLSKGRLLLPQP